MKFQEKLQYKIRNYLYDKDRQRLNKKNIKGNSTDNWGGSDQEHEGGILGFFDEMDDYLGKQLDNVTNKKK